MLRQSALAVCLLLPGEGLGASVYLNDVNIDGVNNRQFPHCSVRIDQHGDIHITTHAKTLSRQAPALAPAPTPTLPAHPVQRYWLVTEKAAPGMTQYDVDLFINSRWVRKFLDDEEHVVMELTKFLRSGSNRMVFVAKKNLRGTRRSASPQHYFRIVVGQGDSAGRKVMISRKLIDYKRTALETKDFKNDFTVIVQ